MKNNIKYLSLLLAITISFMACETVDFGDTNVNLNEPSDAAPASLFTNAQRSVSGYVASTTSNLYVQYLSNGQYNDESLYVNTNFSYNSYYAVLTDLKKIIEGDAEVVSSNQVAAATILRAWFLHGMTDRWGMIPYTEALQGLENQYPKFDLQEVVYNGLINELNSALGMITSGSGPSGDIMFGGDMDVWRTFGNTIKMTIGLRLSNADSGLGSTTFNSAMSGAISSNSENLFYSYLSADTNDNPWEDRFETRRDYLLSGVFVNSLIGNGTSDAPEDPRLSKMGDKSTLKGVYVGAPYGDVNSDTDNYSFITSDIIYNPTASLMIYTYSEMLFAKAEAVELGWISGDAETLFKDAIAASMAQWGVDAGDAQSYIDGRTYTGPSDIAYEKWVAMFLQGYNSWAEYRRQKAHGYERPLTAPSGIFGNATDIPDRHGYSTTAVSLNEASYNAAIAAQGPDELNTKTWINK